MAGLSDKLLQIKVEARKQYLRIDKFTGTSGDRIFNKQALNNFTQDQAKFIALKIKQHIEENLMQAKRFDTGQQVAKLAPATVKRKGFKRPFLETGKLFESISIKKVGKGYAVYVLKRRAEIAAALHFGGVRKVKYKKSYKAKGKAILETKNKGGRIKELKPGTITLPARPFFGVNKKNLTEIVKSAMIEEKIRKFFK